MSAVLYRKRSWPTHDPQRQTTPTPEGIKKQRVAFSQHDMNSVSATSSLVHAHARSTLVSSAPAVLPRRHAGPNTPSPSPHPTTPVAIPTGLPADMAESGSGSCSQQGMPLSCPHPARAPVSRTSSALSTLAPATQHAQTPPAIPTIPLLYHTSLAAHAASASHLRQAFLPPDLVPSPECPIMLSLPGRKEPTAYFPDPGAAHIALRLLVLALDLLRTGLQQSGMSNLERAAFGTEFADVGIKVVEVVERMRGMREAEKDELGVVVDVERLTADLEDTIAKSLAIATSPNLKMYRHALELHGARLAFIRDNGHHGRRMVKQALNSTPRDEVKHRYSLQLLLLHHLDEVNSNEFFGVSKELEKEAESNGHTEVVQLVHLARVRVHFNQRRWENLPETIEKALQVAGLPDIARLSEFSSKGGPNLMWRASLAAHLILLKCLCYGRQGENDRVKMSMKHLYVFMDDMAERHVFAEMRDNGGVVKLPVGSPSAPDEFLCIQSTPINLLYTLTYLATTISRRDFAGANRSCRTLAHCRAMREFEGAARAEDCWDSGFSSVHGLADAMDLRATINTVRVDVMMEEALALIYRSSFREADVVLDQVVKHLRATNLFHTHFPQLALLYGQFAHSLGLPEFAVRYYNAAKARIMPGSELYILVEIGLLCAQGILEHLDDPELVTHVNRIADACRSGSNAILHGVGSFLSSLTDPERMSSKRRLSYAYNICRKANQNMLHCLIFAFTTGPHLYGDLDRQVKQLEGGRHIAYMMGGKDRADEVGQPYVGMWYAVKLRDFYRLTGRFDDEAKADASIVRHQARLAEIRAFGAKRFKHFLQ